MGNDELDNLIEGTLKKYDFQNDIIDAQNRIKEALLEKNTLPNLEDFSLKHHEGNVKAEVGAFMLSQKNRGELEHSKFTQKDINKDKEIALSADKVLGAFRELTVQEEGHVEEMTKKAGFSNLDNALELSFRSSQAFDKMFGCISKAGTRQEQLESEKILGKVLDSINKDLHPDAKVKISGFNGGKGGLAG